MKKQPQKYFMEISFEQRQRFSNCYGLEKWYPTVTATSEREAIAEAKRATRRCYFGRPIKNIVCVNIKITD